MSVIGRRAFLKRLAVGAGAVVAAPVLAHVAVPKRRGVSQRLVSEYFVSSGMPTRMDVLYGFSNLRPSLGVVIIDA